MAESRSDRVVTPDEAIQERQRMAAREAAAAPDAPPLTETVSGGRYVTDTGDVVDANGKLIDDKKD